MNFREYKQLASRTINYNLNKEEKLENFLFGLVGETGEVIDLMKKHFFHSHELNKEELEKELGDITWYLAGTLTVLNVGIEYDTIKKLKYYPPKKESFKDLIKSINSLTSKLLIEKKRNNTFLISKIIKEILININVICVLYEIDFKEMLKKNIQKLIERYPQGFSSEKSIGRKEGK